MAGAGIRTNNLTARVPKQESKPAYDISLLDVEKQLLAVYIALRNHDFGVAKGYAKHALRLLNKIQRAEFIRVHTHSPAPLVGTPPVYTNEYNTGFQFDTHRKQLLELELSLKALRASMDGT